MLELLILIGLTLWLMAALRSCVHHRCGCSSNCAGCSGSCSSRGLHERT
ncbi:hypothetical protein SAMN05216343_11215 [Oscillibacter sp. PC13]|nr:hypothetical protein [Oscillibacter sp. PC13]SFP68266.1 hypothetical protein SAMN05216343_11215 [Oscillibacter sp. PC13]